MRGAAAFAPPPEVRPKHAGKVPGALQTFLSRARAARSLPQLPVILVELLNVLRDEQVSTERLIEVIQKDPALCGKLLELANSAAFGVRRKVASVRQAVVNLGLRTVKTMALSFCVVDKMHVKPDSALDLSEYWVRSLTLATGARRIACESRQCEPEEAFVSGLLADIGILVAMQCNPAEYATLYTEAGGAREKLHALECERLGFSHAQLGAELLRSWNLPESICTAAARHHESMSFGSQPRADRPWGDALPRIVRAAELVAQVFRRELACEKLAEVQATVRELVGLDEAALDRALNGLDEALRHVTSVLALDTVQTVSYEQLRAEAAAQLAQLSLEAELERASAEQRERAAREQAERLAQEKEAIRQVAETDALTGLANRAAFDAHLDQALRQAAQAGEPLSLILLDVDHFKQFNDRHGHQAGDAVLREVAGCLRETAGSALFVARYGGEEFAVIAGAMTGERLRALAERLRQALEHRTIQHEGVQLRVTASFGAATIRRTSDVPDGGRLIEAADRQLYAAKRNGRNRVELADDPIG